MLLGSINTAAVSLFTITVGKKPSNAEFFVDETPEVETLLKQLAALSAQQDTPFGVRSAPMSRNMSLPLFGGGGDSTAQTRLKMPFTSRAFALATVAEDHPGTTNMPATLEEYQSKAGAEDEAPEF